MVYFYPIDYSEEINKSGEGWDCCTQVIGCIQMISNCEIHVYRQKGVGKFITKMNSALFCLLSWDFFKLNSVVRLTCLLKNIIF